ncbi:retrovirus-related pol polyprotein from transposon TNT 1-94 [Tanacetum coccineum]
MDDELRALEENNTWEVTSLSKYKKAIACYWIYKTKLKFDGSLDRKKATLVINGNRQRKGVNYEETFDLVIKMVTVRAFLVVAAMNGWDTCQIDVSNAFLHGDLFEEVYMQMPQGYIGQGENVKGTSSTLGWKFARSKQEIFISQKKYTLDLLTEAGLSNAKAYKLLMDSHVKLQIWELLFLIHEFIEDILASSFIS